MPYPGVSILVLVDAALRQYHRLPPVPQLIGVSILVLVDAALRHNMETEITRYVAGFNPCFSGCRPATF